MIRPHNDAAAVRLRIRFARDEALAFVSHLDLMRFWERAMRRAGLPLSYSQGYTPHPRLSMAAPLALGVTSEAELMDVFLSRRLSAQGFAAALRLQLPTGIRLLEAGAIPHDIPSLQSLVRFAEYLVTADPSAEGPQDIAGAIDNFLARRTFLWQHSRDTGVRSYDLRVLVCALSLERRTEGSVTLRMMLRCDPGGAGRPEQVLAALGFPRPPMSVHRTKLVLAAPGAPRR